MAHTRPSRKKPVVPTPSPDAVTCDVAFPEGVASFDPQRVGYAVLDGEGRVLAAFGLARAKAADDPVWAALAHSVRGCGQAEVLEGVHRMWVAQVGPGRIDILVTDASSEVDCMERLDHFQRHAQALERLGKALTRNQSTQALAMGILHALYSALDLLAALLWVVNEDGTLEIADTVGIDRGAIAGLARPVLGEGAKTAAGLVATSLKPLLVPRVCANPLTAEHEALLVADDTSAIILPLVSAGQLMGVLELVARIEDQRFLRRHGMWVSLAEHVAMGIHSAIMFEKTERMASLDPLTGIANHRSMQEYLALRIVEAQRERKPVGVVMLDVDHFRRFNEEQGHDVGDTVLKAVASCLSSHLRGYDMAARYGGEEFTLVLPGSDLATTEKAAERVRKAIEGLDTGHAPITASLGCAAFPESGNDAPTLLKAADNALYEAKHSGRNRVAVAGEGRRRAC
ncbi:MAG: sensor domain-containing diguanylate cyclase [Fimbriimonadaceae bacterium]|nr:sensor domain-containing diguanylate cyclase [Fimbriimonadaceae bacterium]